MGRKKSKPAPLPTLEEQLAAHDAVEPPDGIILDRDGAPHAPSAARQTWVRKRLAIVDDIRHRDSKRMRDPGPDEGGRWSAPPYALQHGHAEEVAPKNLGKEIPKDLTQHPKRIATQRMIDRYKTQGLITARQWRAADRLWRIWRESGRDPSLIGNYSPDVARGAPDPDRKMIGRTEAVADWEDCRRLSGVLGFSALVDVVIWDRSASDWARGKGHSVRVSADIGMAFLRGGLDVLVAHFRY